MDGRACEHNGVDGRGVEPFDNTRRAIATPFVVVDVPLRVTQARLNDPATKCGEGSHELCRLHLPLGVDDDKSRRGIEIVLDEPCQCSGLDIGRR